MTVGPHRFVELDWRDRRVRIEHCFVEPSVAQARPAEGVPGGPATPAQVPLMVFLHEGLGSLSMWKDFPQRLCDALSMQGLVFSRPGYGRSTPGRPGQAWAPDYLHQQAAEVLPALLHALSIDPRRRPVWLFGHSDGGSIALLHAAQPGNAIAGLVLLAPHIRVEDISIRSIAQAGIDYAETDLRQKLARHHDDPDGAFRCWNDIWLHPDFRDWSIADEIATIDCPVLAVQGTDDAYGTLAQIRGIAERVPQTRLLELADCGHSPHRDQPDQLIAAVQAFLAGAATIAQPSTATLPGDNRP